jgi:hypothetical protein
MKLIFAGLAVFCVRAMAQTAIPPVPSEPLLPTDIQDCNDFRAAYTKVLDKINEAVVACRPANIQDVVAGPSSCIEWSKGSALFKTVPRTCARVNDQWCRAALDLDQKFDDCKVKVENYEIKKRIIEEAFLHKKPDRQRTDTDDEIDLAFKAINAKGITGGQSKIVQAVETSGVDVIKATEKEAFAELDNTLRRDDFAEINRALLPPPALDRKPTGPVANSPRKLDPSTIQNTSWTWTGVETRYTLHFSVDDRVTKEVMSYGNRRLYEGTWKPAEDGVIVEWRYDVTSAYCGNGRDGVTGHNCRERVEYAEHFVLRNGALVYGSEEYHPR